ncbi:hypothetical protein BXZ70DRAFT_967799 [Cristinia sonorae]|uniref:Amidohydrolase-related domain-containing protein n=1 Tax=Cristinia sonorae TaxID=1940300 RepID=A0A8K0UWJ8_9AGAR|nr:hypothetical protein BXZ70DRAFT_967799 [Cristinia sonorae]
MLFRGDFVSSKRLGDLQILHDHLVAVNEQGVITHSEPATSASSRHLLQSDEPKTEIPPGSFLIPTFCDLHLHAPQYLYQGTGLHLPLMEWLNQYAFKAEERIDGDPVLAQRVYERLAERLLESGTGAVVLFGTINENANIILAKAMLSRGLRAYVGKLSMDISSRPTYKEASAQDSLTNAMSFVNNCRALCSDLPETLRTVEPILTPRFVPTCSDKLLTGLGELARDKQLRVQSHLAEAHDQVQWVLQERGVEDIEVFERNGLLTSRTIQAHCTFLPPPSLHKLAHHGTSVAHCPLSNAYFSAEPFRLREALDIGVRVGLGTDIAGGYSIDIMQAMRQAVTVSRMREGQRVIRGDEGRALSIDWKEALFLATKGGAEAMGIQSGIGTFTVSSPFDAQLVRLITVGGTGVGSLDFFDSQTVGGKWVLTEELVEKWWCLGDERNREGIWIQGRKVWPER